MTTKVEFNTRLSTPLTASKLKKASLSELQAVVDALTCSGAAPSACVIICDIFPANCHILLR